MQTAQEFHQVTIVFMGSEIAYGEGETRAYAWEEAQADMPEEYKTLKGAQEDLEVLHIVSAPDEDKNRIEYVQAHKEWVTYWDALTVWC